ncbi:hydantoinase B/oxoprolinase family protein [Mesorhizobium sp. B2-4-6]|uniref:hydantoinase B/oxoprolinase family protein n=1 Tax=Mesorhizobium sp. B2-4-6 TaxID=2589943 RepID=UPI00112DA316|nr:hydantoinase B/oxoprolinase family protein [Mesorhizobium sp. B2-4-6]TPL54037.1 hydantoinase B/oxoprolinase family protein [Mesorhizobium sp. B2-4-6]
MALSGKAKKLAKFDPTLLAVLSSRFESIIREMTNTVMKASRSSVIKNARDMSCGILTYDHRLVSVEEALPIHVNALELTTRPITELFDDVKEGDAFLNNSPFYGVTHHADLTLCVPVFFEGTPLFWTLSRSHHADIGAPEPSTYLPFAATIYQEGVHFPCVRIQENFKDKQDLIRIGLQKIRVSNMWYGDYRAQVGACRTGERRLKELVAQYGIDTVRDFIEAWMDYGERRAIAAIKKLPAGTYIYEVRHDPVAGVADEGIPIKAKVTVDSKKGLITVDVRDNPDCVPGGLNLTEACAVASCRIGVYYNLEASVPHNEGSSSRIVPVLRDGCVVGRPSHPIGTSCATSNVNERLANAVQCAFSEMGEPYGMAEGGGNFSAALGVVSGIDRRREASVEYITQLMLALSGGPANHGHDGWLTYECSVGNGIMVTDSIEVDEATYPILVEERRIRQDSMGFGQWNGAPAVQGAYRSLTGDMTLYVCGDGGTFPAKGVLGGLPGANGGTWRRGRNAEVERLPDFYNGAFTDGEAILYRSCAGGGYGRPDRRDPERVAEDVNRKWLSVATAREVYGVALTLCDNGIDYQVDTAGTERLRATN